MTIQKFMIWMMGQPLVKDSKMDCWILHGAICYAAQLRNKSLALYIVILHIQNNFWFSKSWDFAWHIPRAHTRKLEKLNLLPPMFMMCLAAISICLKKLINHVVKCTLAFAARRATFYCHPWIYVIYLDKWNPIL
jgi:hypothetical protein